MMKLRTHYDNLKLTPDASISDIKLAYRRLCSKHHPDKYPPDKKIQQENIIKIINKAYEVLSDPKSRAEHDRWIQQQTMRSGKKGYGYADKVEEETTLFIKRKGLTLLGMVTAITLGLLLGGLLIYLNTQKKEPAFRPTGTVEHYRGTIDRYTP